jgi:hypothetical protein
MTREPVCARCGYPRREHTYNGACYGVCGEFEEPQTMTQEPRCPICNYEWEHWHVCDHPDCHDGRLPKPRPKTQLEAQLEGLAIGLEQREEKSAAHICRLVLAEMEQLNVRVERLTTLDLVDCQELWALFCDHYWDSIQKDRDVILWHVDAVLKMALEPKPNGNLDRLNETLP